MPNGQFTSSVTPEIEREPSPAVVPEQHYTIPEAATQTAARMYEPGSVGDSWQKYFTELETMGDAWEYEEAAYWEKEYPSDTEAVREFMRSVQEQLKASGVIDKIKRAAKGETKITAEDIEYAFKIYERAVRESIRRLQSELSPQQLSMIKSNAQSQFDHGYRDMLIDHLNAGINGETDIHLSLQDFCLLVNPKAKKVEYMQKSDGLKILRHSMSLASTDQVKRDLAAIKKYEHLAVVKELNQDDEFKKIK